MIETSAQCPHNSITALHLAHVRSDDHVRKKDKYTGLTGSSIPYSYDMIQSSCAYDRQGVMPSERHH